MQLNKSVSSTPKSKHKQKIMVASTLGCTLGIAAAVASCYILKKQSTPQILFKNLTYNEKDILMIGAGSILGGLSGGLLIDNNKKNITPKLREASLQFFGNLATPLSLLFVSNKAMDYYYFKTKPFGNPKSPIPKILASIISLVAGMNIGNKIMNKVNNKIFNQTQNRKVTKMDYLVHTDDILIAANLLLKDSKSISNITSKLLPASFILAGVKTGMQQ